GDMGSAMGSAMPAKGSAGSGSAAPAAPAKPEDLAKKFDDCWAAFNANKMDDFKKCFTADSVYEQPGSGAPPVTGPDAIAAFVATYKTAFPDIKGEKELVLVNGHDVIAVMLVTGTNTGPMKTPMGEMAATNKKIGLFMAQDV